MDLGPFSTWLSSHHYKWAWVHLARGYPAITINVRTWVHLARGYPAIADINGPGIDLGPSSTGLSSHCSYQWTWVHLARGYPAITVSGPGSI